MNRELHINEKNKRIEPKQFVIDYSIVEQAIVKSASRGDKLYEHYMTVLEIDLIASGRQ